MNFIQWLKYRILGAKLKSLGEDMIPKGLTGTVVPKSFDDKVVWDKERFSNIKYLENE